MGKFKLSLMAVSVAAVLAGCASTSSDTLGLADNEGTKTYAEAYAPAREMLMNGQFDEIRAKMVENGQKTVKTEEKDEAGNVKEVSRDASLTDDEEMERLINEQSELAIVERGLISLNVGDVKRALFYFNAAEEKMNRAEADDSAASKASSWGKTGAAAVIGAEEMANYQMRGYEKVMLLNYKALCYMLQGDRKAYNVTRRAIDLQQEEWEKFKKLLAENEAKAAEGTKDVAGLGDAMKNVKIDDRSEDVKAKAELVTSAYVNPFADYLNAMMMEIDGISDSALRSNARIAYQKVVDNNKDCSAARAAVRQVEKGIPKGKKLVQVLISDGFAPYQVEKNFTFPVPLGDKPFNVEVNYASAEPVATDTAGARIMIGGKSANLSSLTKMESLILRDEEDRLPLRATMFVLAAARSALAGHFLGNLGSGLMSKVQHPDTRSWMTLPNQVYVARLVVPESQKTLKIETVSGNGATIAGQTVELAEKGPTVVYGVSYGQHVKAYANAFSWVN